jgi:hypothetical protein
MAKWIKGYWLHFKQVPALSSFVGWLNNYKTILIRLTREWESKPERLVAYVRIS